MLCQPWACLVPDDLAGRRPEQEQRAAMPRRDEEIATTPMRPVARCDRDVIEMQRVVVQLLALRPEEQRVQAIVHHGPREGPAVDQAAFRRHLRDGIVAYPLAEPSVVGKCVGGGRERPQIAVGAHLDRVMRVNSFRIQHGLPSHGPIRIIAPAKVEERYRRQTAALGAWRWRSCPVQPSDRTVAGMRCRIALQSGDQRITTRPSEMRISWTADRRVSLSKPENSRYPGSGAGKTCRQ